MLYPSELLARSRCSSTLAEAQHAGTSRDAIILSGMFRRRYRLFSSGLPVHPFARDRISLASFSISSVFRSMATESTRTESVFSTSAFNSLARS